MLMEMVMVIQLLNGFTDPATAREQNCFIENIVRESIGEGVKGMRLVTEVMLNREAQGYRGSRSWCEVVHSPYQFSWTLIPEDQRRLISDKEYEQGAQVLFSYIYGDLERILPDDALYFINTSAATDLSWYDAEKVVYQHKNHEFLVLD